MPATPGDKTRPALPTAIRARARQWSRTAFALAVVFGTLPLASRIFLGGWGFDGAAEIGCLCLIASAYFHIVSRRFPAVPDPATILERAGERAASGRGDRAIALLTEGIRLSPQVWQSFQYRGELYLQGEQAAAAQRDFSEAIRLAPGERHLYLLRGRAYSLLGDESSARSDFAKAAELAGEGAAESCAGLNPGPPDRSSC
jgi:tetratricopeptide (TPR) repeat protein